LLLRCGPDSVGSSSSSTSSNSSTIAPDAGCRSCVHRCCSLLCSRHGVMLFHWTLAWTYRAAVQLPVDDKAPAAAAAAADSCKSHGFITLQHSGLPRRLALQLLLISLDSCVNLPHIPCTNAHILSNRHATSDFVSTVCACRRCPSFWTSWWTLSLQWCCQSVWCWS
jgi:hypothetical protein